MSHPSLIDAIVAGVLKQLGQTASAPRETSPPVQGSQVQPSPTTSEEAIVPLTGKVITAELLAEQVATSGRISVQSKAIITPAAWDWIKEHRIQLVRGTSSVPKKTDSTDSEAKTSLQPLLIVVHSTPAVDQLWDQLKASWRREFLGCPDDAAKLAIAELSRGGTSVVVILAEQTFRAACLSNRHDKVKAVALGATQEIKLARQQLRVNTWCVNPKGKSWFELKTLFSTLNTPQN